MTVSVMAVRMVLLIIVCLFVIDHPVSCQGEYINILGNSIYTQDLLFHESTLVVMALAN